LLEQVLPPGVVDVGKALFQFGELAFAAREIADAQIAVPRGRRLESISRSAGVLLFQAGVVPSVDDGIVLFHERVGRDKPALRKLLRDLDVREGRIRRPKMTAGQRIVVEAVKAGAVTRDKAGRIKKLGPAALRALRENRKREVREEAAKRQKRLKAFKRRVGVRR